MLRLGLSSKSKFEKFKLFRNYFILKSIDIITSIDGISFNKSIFDFKNNLLMAVAMCVF